MTAYDALIAEAAKHGIRVVEMRIESGAKGLIKGNKIGISSAIGTLTEKTCVLAEEIGHYHLTVGDILDQSVISNRKQERRARSWGYARLITLSDLIRANLAGIRNRYELAEFLGVTEPYLEAALTRMQERFGIAVYHNDFLITFDPLNVLEPYSI